MDTLCFEVSDSADPLNPPRETFNSDHPAVLRLLSLYGSQSNSLIMRQPGVAFWGDASGVIGYRSLLTWRGRVQIVFANPLCPPAAYRHYLSAFVKAHPRSLFVAVCEKVRLVLAALGYETNHFGWEHRLDLAAFQLEGGQRKALRKTRNHWRRRGVTVRELPWSDIQDDAVLGLSGRWRESRRVRQRELDLFTRPPAFREEADVRKFYCFEGGRLIGFVFFLAIYREGQVVGYGANITRGLRARGYSGVTDFILLEAAEQFRREGLECLSLGISPLHDLFPVTHERPRLRRILAWCYSGLDRFYAFRGLAQHKRKFRAPAEPWFLCARPWMSALLLAWCLGVSSRVFGLGRDLREPRGD